MASVHRIRITHGCPVQLSGKHIFRGRPSIQGRRIHGHPSASVVSHQPALILNPGHPPGTWGMKDPRAALPECYFTVMSVPFPRSARSDDPRLPIDRGGRWIHQLPAAHRELYDRIKLQQGLVMCDVFLRLRLRHER